MPSTPQPAPKQKKPHELAVDIKSRISIRDAWSALGGGKLRANRGQGFWRGGDGYSVALYPDRGAWHDFVANEGGDVIALVQTARQCGFREAVGWLADLAGIPKAVDIVTSFPREDDSGWAADLVWATWWRMATETFAEYALESLDCAHAERRGLTTLLRTIRLGDAALVAEYRKWRQRDSQLTTAMAKAGQRSDARTQRRLARWIARNYGGPET
jgi:hypothetical protein